MEGRQPPALHLETTDLTAAEYRARRAGVFAEARSTLFDAVVPGRPDLPRTLPEFARLAVHEVAADAPLPPPDPDVTGSYRFERTARPGQGTISGEPTNAVELVLISPRDEAGEQALRDWGDHVHIRHIAEAGVPGFRMITPYRNPGAGPRFLHLYELHADDPDFAFRAMAPLVAARFGGVDTDAYRAWFDHPQLQIDYVNTFLRVED